MQFYFLYYHFCWKQQIYATSSIRWQVLERIMVHIIALTGVPGTGKTTVATALRKKGYRVQSDKDFFSLCGEGDPVELDMVCVQQNMGDYTIFESHTAHLIKCELVIQLTCSNYAALRERLIDRGYPAKKVQDNLDSEIFNVIGDEIACPNHVCIETSGLTIDEVVKRVERAITQLTSHNLYKVF